MAFLFLWVIITPFIGLTAMGNLIVNMAVAILTFLLVLILQYSHKQDIRALQARVDALVAEQHDAAPKAGLENLNDEELKAIRDLLSRRKDQEDIRRHNRDSRPSLF